jgi:hypothetical protein
MCVLSHGHCLPWFLVSLDDEPGTFDDPLGTVERMQVQQQLQQPFSPALRQALIDVIHLRAPSHPCAACVCAIAFPAFLGHDFELEWALAQYVERTAWGWG